MCECIAVIGQGEQLDETVLIEAELHLVHILLSLGHHIAEKPQSVADRYREVVLAPGDLDAS